MNKLNTFPYILIFILFRQVTLSAQGTWESVNSPTDKYLRSVYFVDSLNGWAVGDSGTIIQSSNGGVDWVAQNSKTTNNIYDVFFLNKNLGWASSWNVSNVPFGTELLKTTDGGINWSKRYYPEENYFINCILFTDSLKGWMGGKPYPMVKTTNGGNTWQHAVIDSSVFAFFPVKDIKFYNSQYGYASGGVLEYGGVIWNTTNGGDLWNAIDPSFAPADPFWQIHLFDSLNVIGVGGDFEFFGVGMIRTSDGGLHWDYKYIGMPGVANDVDFRTALEAWASLGYQQKLIYSLDSGYTWNSIPTPGNAIISDLTFQDSLHGIAVGKDGVILKYKPPIVSAVTENGDFIKKEFCLNQNYPNPFNPATKITYSISEDSFVKLSVYNLLGKLVAVLVNENQLAGTYQIEFNAEDLPAGKQSLSSGIYIYTLNTPNFRNSKKMILVR